MRSATTAAALAALLPIAFAQTFTSCNPTKKSCPKDTGLNAGSFTSDFTSGSGAAKSWTLAEGTKLNYGNNGAEFTIETASQAPTISTDFYFFFGRVDVKARAAPGTGIVSSIVFQSDDLDEVDWEFTGGNTSSVETNFFGKGVSSGYNNALYYPVDDCINDFHTYSIDWTSERLEWIIDGVTVRTLTYEDADNGAKYPQTPMVLKLGNWDAGGPNEPEGTAAWAGGRTDFSQAPFNMYVDSVTVTNYNPADAYEYTDETGSWKSIKIIKDGSSSSPTGGSNNGSSVSTGSTATTAPTQSLTVSNIKQTNVAVSTTETGSSYSMNTASASAENSGKNGGASGSLTTSATGSATLATQTASGTGSGSGSGNGTATGSAPSSTSSYNAASTNSMITTGTFLSMVLALLAL